MTKSILYAVLIGLRQQPEADLRRGAHYRLGSDLHVPCNRRVGRVAQDRRAPEAMQ